MLFFVAFISISKRRSASFAVAVSNGVGMKKITPVSLSEFETHAQKTISLAIEICEDKIKTNSCRITPEIKVLAATVTSLRDAICAFMEAERL